jgi:hypothetical protein
VTLGNACAETIDGKGTAATIRKEIAAEVADLKEKTGKVGSSSAPACRHACDGMLQDASMTRMILPFVAFRCRAWL